MSISDEWITIEIDIPTIISQEVEYKRVVALCERKKYIEAKPILKNLIQKNPSNSEYHRIMGQLLSDEGNQEEAINSLIDSLRWNAKNGWALIMMGNIFAKFKNDIPIAMKYYDQAIISNPQDNIAVNNIGANLMQQGKLEEAKKYFWKALGINNKYPNTHFALGLIAEQEGDFYSSFYNTIQAIKFNSNKDELYQNSVNQAFEVSQKIVGLDEGKKIFRKYRHKLESDGDKGINIEGENDIPTAAKIEFAENYDRLYHLVKYNPSYPAVEHLIMHELVHLDFVINARKDGLNQLFVATQQHKAHFIKNLEPTINKLHKMGIAEQSISNYCSSLFDGINRQIFNTPIDLFIENFLFYEYPELRPFQFISLYNLIQEAIKAVTDKKIVELSPKEILSKSKIYNLVGCMQFKDLYGINLLANFQANQSELKLATDFYNEFLQYRDDKEPAEEYEMVLHWAEDLHLDKNFELVNEVEYRTKRIDIENLLNSIEKDPFYLESKDPLKQREMNKFQQSQQHIGINMAVTMYMLDALQFFKEKSKEEIKKIAFEIAMNGTQGYRPDKEGYSINSIAGKLFSGYHILAYYYVSWALAIPEMLPQLQLPYDEEYQMAQTMYKTNI